MRKTQARRLCYFGRRQRSPFSFRRLDEETLNESGDEAPSHLATPDARGAASLPSQWQLLINWRNAPKKLTQNIAGEKRVGQEDVDSDYLFANCLQPVTLTNAFAVVINHGDPGRVVDVVKRVTVQYNKIRQLTGLERSSVACADHFGTCFRCANERVHWTE